jgi:hypothetical protein
MKKLIAALFILLSGCSVTNGDYKLLSGDLYTPKVSTGFYGKILAEPFSDFEPELESYCLKINRKLDKGSLEIEKTTILGEKIVRYHCEELPRVNPVQSTYSQEQEATPSGFESTQIRDNSSDKSNIQIETAPTEKTSSPLDLSTAKRKCSDLGFKPKTEKFGRCVLELSK